MTIIIMTMIIILTTVKVKLTRVIYVFLESTSKVTRTTLIDGLR